MESRVWIIRPIVDFLQVNIDEIVGTVEVLASFFMLVDNALIFSKLTH